MARGCTTLLVLMALCAGSAAASEQSEGVGRSLQQTETPVVGVVAPVVGTLPVRAATPEAEGTLLLTGPPILVAGTIVSPAAEPASMGGGGRKLKAESMEQTEMGRRLLQEGSLGLVPLAEEFLGRRLMQEEESEMLPELGLVPMMEEPEMGRRLLQAGEEVIAPTAISVLGAPMAEALLTGRRLLQDPAVSEAEDAILMASVTEELAEAGMGGRKLAQALVDLPSVAAPMAEIAAEMPGGGRRLLQDTAGSVIAGSEITPGPVAEELGEIPAGRKLMQAESVTPREAALLVPLAEAIAQAVPTPSGGGRKLQEGRDDAEADDVTMGRRLLQAESVTPREAALLVPVAEAIAQAVPTPSGGGRKLAQAGDVLAPTAVSVLGAPTAEALLTGRRLLQAESVTPREAALLVPVAEAIAQAVPTPSGGGRKLAQAGGEVIAPTAISVLGAPTAEALLTGRRLLQDTAGSVVAGSEITPGPVAEELGEIPSGRKLMQTESVTPREAALLVLVAEAIAQAVPTPSGGGRKLAQAESVTPREAALLVPVAEAIAQAVPTPSGGGRKLAQA